MPLTPRSRLVNPRLGTYFGIASAALVGLTLLLVLLEAMGTSAATLGLAFACGPVLLYLVIAVGSASNEPADFLASGRRVPAFFNGLVTAVTMVGGAGLLGLTGALFLAGFDALCILSGLAAGLVVLALMVAPFLRKCGAPTLAGFLGMRFASSRLRVLTALATLVPLVLLLVAEMRAAAWIASLLTGTSIEAMAALVAVALIIVLVPGGMRSQSWAAAAMAIAVFLALLTPVTLLAVASINIPLPQLSHGVVLRTLGRAETIHALPATSAGFLTFALPGLGASLFSGRFATPFTSIGTGGFIAATFAVMLGIAASPCLAQRSGTTPSVYEMRKSVGWAVFVLAVMLTTVSAIATFMRDAILSQVAGTELARQPAWFRDLMSMGFAEVATKSGRLGIGGIRFHRDATLFALPTVAGQVYALTAVALAGALAAAIAAASQAALAMATTLAEDILAVARPPASPLARLTAVRGATALVLLVTALAAARLEPDPLDCLIAAWCFSAAALFPVLMLSIWWKDLNGWGALTSVAVGLALAVPAVVAAIADWSPLPLPLTALGGALASALAAISVTLATMAPSRETPEFVRDVRVPGGETIYDREARIQRARERPGR